MGGWSGGVFTRFRNWVSDKANSINPQAALFDQEDDGFASGLNNCITKDGLNKPSSPMDWNGQTLTGVLNLANTGTLSLIGGKLTGNLAGNLAVAAPVAGTALTVATQSSLPGITINSAVSTAATYEMDVNSVPQGYVGTSGGASQVITGSAANDVCIRTQGGNLLFSTNSGAGVGAKLAGANGAFSVQDAGGTLQSVGWLSAPQNLQGSYTLVLADAGKSIATTSTGATFAIPSNASVPYPLGTTLVFVNGAAGNISISINTDVLVLSQTGTTGTRTLGSNGIATAYKFNATTWLITGTNLT